MDDENGCTQAGCGFLFVMGIQIVAMVWVFNSAFGLVKSALVGAAMSVSSWILALFGLLPYFGQKLSGGLFTPGCTSASAASCCDLA